MGQYKPLLAAFALSKASLKATWRSPTSIVFSLLFPIIFIVVFGSMVDNTIIQMKIALAPGCDTGNVLYKAISGISNISINGGISQTSATDALQKGRLTAILNIKKDSGQSLAPHYNIFITTSAASAGAGELLKTLLNNTITSTNKNIFPSNPSIAALHTNQLPGRVYRQIDFILPGQLGFSLLMAGIFGSAFLLFNLRKSLVLKRLSATPISRTYLIVGEMLSRLVFQVISFNIMIALGYFAFNFTLVNGAFTFIEMLVFSLFGLIIFMGLGFIISGVIENESSIAPVANTITLPQILLCGLFFPIENYPHWLQHFCNILPLTFFVDGLRKIAFEGAHVWQMPLQLTGLCVWAILISIACIQVFKWE
ncbi:MAG: ABC transporter permease [Parafilimonas sp.]